jgi:hypothetical protein
MQREQVSRYPRRAGKIEARVALQHGCPKAKPIKQPQARLGRATGAPLVDIHASKNRSLARAPATPNLAQHYSILDENARRTYVGEHTLANASRRQGNRIWEWLSRWPQPLPASYGMHTAHLAEAIKEILIRSSPRKRIGANISGPFPGSMERGRRPLRNAVRGLAQGLFREAAPLLLSTKRLCFADRFFRWVPGSVPLGCASLHGPGKGKLPYVSAYALSRGGAEMHGSNPGHVSTSGWDFTAEKDVHAVVPRKAEVWARSRRKLISARRSSP